MSVEFVIKKGKLRSRRKFKQVKNSAWKTFLAIDVRDTNKENPARGQINVKYYLKVMFHSCLELLRGSWLIQQMGPDL